MIRILLALYVAVLLFLSLNPWVKPSGEAAVGGIGWDKIDHAIAYGGLTVLMVLAFSRTGRGCRPIVLGTLAATAIGLLTEYCQAWFATGRMFSYFDLYANGLGSVLGAAVFLGVRWFSLALRQSSFRLRM